MNDRSAARLLNDSRAALNPDHRDECVDPCIVGLLPQ